MARPKKRKIETAEATPEDAAEVECDTGDTGEQQPGLDESIKASAKVDPSSGPGGKRWKEAFEKWKEVSFEAVKLRAIAGKYAEQEKLAQRLHDAKMRRLDTMATSSSGGRAPSGLLVGPMRPS